jgi:large subunit ribosomal protein L10
MAVTKEKKQEILKDLEDKFQKAKAVYFSHYRGLDVKSLENLRKQMREQDIDFKVAKKTLMKLAAKNKGLADLPEDFMEGPVGATFSYEDEISGAKLLYTFAKGNEALEILGGIIEGRFVTKEEALELAQLPSKEELIAKLIGSIKSPISGFYGVLSGVMRNFVYVLQAVHDKMPAEEEPPKE